MAHYLLSVHSVEGEVREPPSEAAVREFQQRLGDVEKDLKATGTWVFSARLDEPAAARVVREAGDRVLTTDGPFAEGKGARRRLLPDRSRRPRRRARVGGPGHRGHPRPDRSAPARGIRGLIRGGDLGSGVTLAP